MKLKILVSALFNCGRAVSLARPLTSPSSCPIVSLNASTNIWSQYTLHPNPFYRQQVIDAAEVIQDATLQKKALKIADVGTFFSLSVEPPFLPTTSVCIEFFKLTLLHFQEQTRRYRKTCNTVGRRNTM